MTNKSGGDREILKQEPADSILPLSSKAKNGTTKDPTNPVLLLRWVPQALLYWLRAFESAAHERCPGPQPGFSDN